MSLEKIVTLTCFAEKFWVLFVLKSRKSLLFIIGFVLKKHNISVHRRTKPLVPEDSMVATAIIADHLSTGVFSQ